MRFIVLQRRTMWVGKLQKILIVKKRCLFGYNVWSQSCCSCWWIAIHFFNIFFCSVSPSFPGSWLEVRRSWGVWAASVPRGRAGEERSTGSLTCSKCRTSSMTGWRKESVNISVQKGFWSIFTRRHQAPDRWRMWCGWSPWCGPWRSQAFCAFVATPLDTSQNKKHEKCFCCN